LCCVSNSFLVCSFAVVLLVADAQVESFQFLLTVALLLRDAACRHTPDFPHELLAMMLHNLYWLRVRRGCAESISVSFYFLSL
jgi:hypothetical protein